MNGAVRTEIIENCTLYQGDCSVILPQLPNFDLILTDPPYGLGEKHNGGGGGEKSTWKHNQSEAKAFDMARPSLQVFQLMNGAAKNVIIWGGNYFADLLPPKMGWLVWDKGLNGFSTSDFEMAWTSRDFAARRLLYHCGNERGFAPKSKEPRKFINSHPTQKPTKLMAWCLDFFPDAMTVCDPFMGSGTTGVACARQGKHFVGIEREPKYFDIACKRIEVAYKTKPMLFESINKETPQQENLFDNMGDVA